MLIIALLGQTDSVYKEIIGAFAKDRLIFWDQETQDRYSEFCLESDSSDRFVRFTDEQIQVFLYLKV